MAIDFSWVTSLSQWAWLQGLFGGAGATLLWEGVIKPSRERRSLAHALAEETRRNLNVVALQLDLMGENGSPEVVRSWTPLSTIVFQATLPRVGELPRDLVSKVVAVSQVAEAVNRWPPMILAEWDEIRPGLPGASGNLTTAQTQKLDHIQALYATFEDWLNKFSRYCDKISPELRRGLDSMVPG